MVIGGTVEKMVGEEKAREEVESPCEHTLGSWGRVGALEAKRGGATT